MKAALTFCDHPSIGKTADDEWRCLDCTASFRPADHEMGLCNVGLYGYGLCALEVDHEGVHQFEAMEP
jgi:hypothetical protein